MLCNTTFLLIRNPTENVWPDTGSTTSYVASMISHRHDDWSEVLTKSAEQPPLTVRKIKNAVLWRFLLSWLSPHFVDNKQAEVVSSWAELFQNAGFGDICGDRALLSSCACMQIVFAWTPFEFFYSIRAIHNRCATQKYIYLLNCSGEFEIGRWAENHTLQGWWNPKLMSWILWLAQPDPSLLFSCSPCLEWVGERFFSRRVDGHHVTQGTFSYLLQWVRWHICIRHFGSCFLLISLVISTGMSIVFLNLYFDSRINSTQWLIFSKALAFDNPIGGFTSMSTSNRTFCTSQRLSPN